MGNSALSVLRATLRDLLNEPTSGRSFWTDAQLNKYINMAYREFYNRWCKNNPEWGKFIETLTYTSSAESVTFTPSSMPGDLVSVDYIEDCTYDTPGEPVPMARTREELNRRYAEINDTVVCSYPAVAYIEVVPSISSGVHTLAFKVYLAPKPSGARSLRLHCQGRPQTLSADTYTTGLPDPVEDCIVFRAAILARIQEGLERSGFETLLKAAEHSMAESTKGFQRGPDETVYYPEP